jgi:uncharacterized protein YndB with AHSA1/START domain
MGLLNTSQHESENNYIEKQGVRATPREKQERWSHSTKFETVHLERIFRAPVTRVWEAWSNSELIKEWWGPYQFTAPRAENDFREGGKYLFAMQAPDGKVVWSGGMYEKIIPYKKIVFTDHFSGKYGQMNSTQDKGLGVRVPKVLRVTINFESVKPNETKIVIQHEGIPFEMHDDCLQGWNSSFNKMQELVEVEGIRR